MKLFASISSELSYLIDDDSVRPELSYAFRVTNGRECYVLAEETPLAVICVAYTHQVPTNISELEEYCFNDTNDPNGIAVFYTVWSYKNGAGRDIVFSVVDHIKHFKPWIGRFVTLSPKTEMARRFHLKNGAFTLSDNADSVNYEYRV
jgi:hypothetical protein